MFDAGIAVQRLIELIIEPYASEAVEQRIEIPLDEPHPKLQFSHYKRHIGRVKATLSEIGRDGLHFSFANA